jgi:type II secretory pathway component PulF
MTGVALGLLALVGIAVLVTTKWRRPVDGVTIGRATAFRLPFLGPIRLYAANAEFCSTLALLVRRKIPLDQALDLTAAATSQTDLAGRVRGMADAASDGAGLAEAVGDGGVIAPSLLWLLETAEDRGRGEDALLDIARIYRRRLERAVDRLTLLLGPAIELVVGIVVFLLALDFVFPFSDVLRLSRMLSMP